MVVIQHGENKGTVLVAVISSATFISSMALLVAVYFLRKRALNDQCPPMSYSEGDRQVSEEGPKGDLQMSSEGTSLKWVLERRFFFQMR